MSELRTYDVIMTPSSDGSWVLKSEADKVIAEKDKEIAELKAKIIKSKELADGIKCDIEKVKADAAETLSLLEERNKQVGELKKQVHDYAQGLYVMQARAEKEARHDKYKRCLDVSMWCDTKADWYYSISGFSESFRDRVDFYIKWRDKWRELAEKFKEAK